MAIKQSETKENINRKTTDKRGRALIKMIRMKKLSQINYLIELNAK